MHRLGDVGDRSQHDPLPGDLGSVEEFHDNIDMGSVSKSKVQDGIVLPEIATIAL